MTVVLTSLHASEINALRKTRETLKYKKRKIQLKLHSVNWNFTMKEALKFSIFLLIAIGASNGNLDITNSIKTL